MSRPPTPEEIRATNPNMLQRCDKCDLAQHASEHFGTFDNMLTLTASGGYVDNYGISEGAREFHLCHRCAHKLMAQFFSQWDLSGWHSRTQNKYCDGWTIQDWSDSQITRLELGDES